MMAEIPREVTHVAGCDCCGSAQTHRTDCAIWQLPVGQREANVRAAAVRERAHMDALTAFHPPRRGRP